MTKRTPGAYETDLNILRVIDLVLEISAAVAGWFLIRPGWGTVLFVFIVWSVAKAVGIVQGEYQERL